MSRGQRGSDADGEEASSLLVQLGGQLGAHWTPEEPLSRFGASRGEP